MEYIELCCLVNKIGKCYQCLRAICKDHSTYFNARPMYAQAKMVCRECSAHLIKGYYGHINQRR